MRLLSAGEGQIVPFLGPSLPDWADIIRHSPLEDSVGTQWETRGKNAGRGLGRKHFPQKKVLSLVLCVAMLLSVMVMGTGAASFTDQDEFSDNYAEAAEVLTGMGIIQGYDDGSFLPQRNINRAQVATMIYRAATGDVTDSKISQFVGEDLFDDVNADDWFAGYVNYCGNAEYIKGFTPDTFGPYKQVTGYQVLAMILRAVGYDENDEYTGDQWTLRVAATAREQGLLDNLNPDTNLAEPATRELVAELIFQAIHPDVDTVHYVPAEGEYQSDDGTSLGEQVFDLAVKDSADEWGRPEVLWTYNTGDEETVIEIDPVATYTTAVNDCDVYEDTGISGDVAAYVNSGRWNDTYNISKTATKDNIGAQGQLVEVYDYTTVDGKDATRIVVIDTFLAQVTNVTEAKYDSNNHLAKDASLTLTVYDGANTSVTLTNGSTNYTYAEGDMLLINAYTNDKDEVISGDGQHVEIVSAAESFVGAQTTIHYNADTHTINGTEYNDAYKFFRDDAGVTEDYNFTWYLDQYGNVIGATGITSNYAVLKDIIWIQGTPGYAQATLVYMDGTEATVTVNSIDGFDGTTPWATGNDDAVPTLNDSSATIVGKVANVSTDSSLNGDYEGYAMYRVDTNSDGSVNLEGKELYKLPGQTDSYMFEIEYANDVTLDINSSAILDAGVVETHVSNATQFLVNDNGTYTAYTGTANLPDFNWQTVEVFYDDEDGDNVADYVYIKTFSNVHGMYVFATSDAHSIKTDDYGVYLEGVYVDGVETTIVADPDVAHELIANQGKLYFADWVVADNTSIRYGVLEDITLVNEKVDYDGRVFDETFANYLNPDMDDNFNYVNGTLVVSKDLSYNVGSTVEVIYTNETYTMNLADVVKAMKDGTANYGLWVVGDRFNNTYTVYAGTELSNDTSISVTATETAEGTNIYDIDLDKDTSTYEVTLKDRNTEGALTVKANNEYAQYQIGSEIFTGDELFIKDYYFGDSFQVIVFPEDGTASKTWTVTVNDYHQIDGVITKVMSSGESSSVGGVTNPLPMYKNFADAVTYAPTLDVDTIQFIALFADNNLVVADQANGDNWTQYAAKSHFFTTTSALNQTTFDANAKMLDFDDNGKSVQIGDVQGWGANSTYVVSMVVRDEDSAFDEVVYFAFHVDK